MKNKILYFLFSLLFINNVLADGFNFKTKNIEVIENKKIIKAKFGTAISNDGNLIINADNFIYEMKSEILNAYENGSIIDKSKNIEVFFDKLILDKNKSIITLNGRIELFDKNKSFKILSDSLTINQNENYIKSNSKSKMIDKFENYYTFDQFFYDIQENLLKAENLVFVDTKNNSFKTSLAYIDIKNDKVISKDIEVNLSKSIKNKNEPRIKGNSAIVNSEVTEIKKGVFTNCEKRDGCPPWKITSDLITHDKNKKQINYEKAKLFIYDVPVLYLPRFFHPDPSVKRQTGFLAPSFNNSINSSKSFLNLPFFYALDHDKDFTFNPRLYSNQDLLLQTEYRQANKNSNHVVDLSFSDLKNENDAHLFYGFDKTLDNKKIKENNLKVKLQQVSNKKYFKKNKLYSDLTDNADILENSINLDLKEDNYSLNLNTTVYEDVNKNKNDRYEILFPKVDFFKKIKNNTKLDGEFSFESNNLARNYNTNVFEKYNINNLYFLSNPKINKNGFENNYEFIVKNTNSDSKNSLNYKNKENMNISGLFQLNSKYPLIKYNENFQNILIPKMSVKVAPEYIKNIKNDENKININNIYSLNRINKTDTIEGGLSLAYGTNYIMKRNVDDLEILSLKIANNLRLKENKDLPRLNQINQKTSNFFTETNFKPNNFFNIRYNSSIRNNLSDISSENLLAEFKFKDLKMSFDYLNENNTKNKNSYLSNTASYNINNSNSLIFKSREDKTSNFVEFYKLIYQYKNDCLAASIEYNKDYYNDNDFNATETIFFKLSIIPFTETSSPNLLN